MPKLMESDVDSDCPKDEVDVVNQQVLQLEGGDVV